MAPHLAAAWAILGAAGLGFVPFPKTVPQAEEFHVTIPTRPFPEQLPEHLSCSAQWAVKPEMLCIVFILFKMESAVLY